jgi:Tfp pilus assembly protein PilO
MRPLFSRIASEKRWWLALIAVALALNVAVYAFVVRPIAARTGSAGARAAAAAEARQQAERQIADLEWEQQARRQAEQDLNAFYEEVLPDSLSAARRTYATLPELAANAGVTSNRRRTDVTAVGEDGRLQRMSVVMELQGTYEDLRQFIYDLEQSEEFIVIDDVTLTEQRDEGSLGLVLTLSIYFPASAP